VRIDLVNSGRRPLLLRAMMRVARAYLGLLPGPPLVLSYRPDLLGADFRRHFLRASLPTSRWSSGELELMGTLVSSLNACRF